MNLIQLYLAYMKFLLKNMLALILILCNTAAFCQVDSLPISSISDTAIAKHIQFLGSDFLEGRATGSTGNKTAASYIKNELSRMGLQPGAGENRYYQSILMHGNTALPESQLRIYSDDQLLFDLELGRDYLLFKSGAQTYVPQPVPVVFVGYGIIASEYDYNDYQSVDVEGKIVAYLSGEPPSDNPDYFMGETSTIYSLPESKQRLAISRGAVGSILIPDTPRRVIANWKKMTREYWFEDVTLAYAVTGHLSIMIHPGIANALFQNAEFSLQEILQRGMDDKITSFPLLVDISFRGEFISRNFFSNNVISLLPGSDPERKNSYLIVSAHYDHLGIGTTVNGDSIYNGVFDNAAGVGAALEIARTFSRLPTPPARSIMFLFLTGEEKGLLGSRYYLDQPVVPLHKTVANINIDGLAMFDTFNDVVGIGAELSDLSEYLSTSASKMGISLSPFPAEFAKAESFARSDQIAFAQAGIPSILVMPGLDLRNTERQAAIDRILNWNREIYHSPFDDLDQQMNLKAAEQHTQLLFALCYEIANSNRAPEWHPDVKYNVPRLQSQAEKR